MLCRKGKHTASGQLIREINEWATERDQRHLMARSHRLLSVFFDFIGDVPSAWEHAVPAVELLDDTMSERMRADHLFGLGQVLVRTGAWDAARERYRAALQLADGLEDVPLRVKILNNLAWLEDDAGDTHQSMEIAKRMQAFAARHNVTLDAACLDTLANAQLKLGHVRRGGGDAASDPRRSRSRYPPDRGAWGSAQHGGECTTTAGTHVGCGSDPRSLHRAVRGARDHRPSASRRSRSAPVLFAAQGMFQRAYEQYIEFHAEDAALRAAQREANARTLQAVFETTEARREGERFRELSLRDALTGLRNRRHVDTELPILLSRSREDGSRCRCGLVDLDHFKLVNDRFSHPVGDKVLVRISGILAAATAESGWAARMGGEEFLLVFPAIDVDEAERRCEDVRQAIEVGPVGGCDGGRGRDREHRLHRAPEWPHQPGSAAGTGGPKSLRREAPGKESGSLRPLLGRSLYDHTLLLVHAHPDDECIATGGVMLRAHHEGVRVVLLTATRGEEGDIHNMDADAVRPRLGEVRTAELMRSCAILGVDRQEFLGYRDSGMAGSASNRDPRSFAAAPLHEAADACRPFPA